MRAGAARGAKFLGGGTNLVDLMKYNVEHPATLVDVNHIGLDKVEEAGGGVRIGASVRNSDLANNPTIVQNYPLLSQALLAGASAQLRNLATTGGNLLQRPRCYYFTDTAFPACNKREPGSGCAAINGYQRLHAVLGQTDEGAKSPHTCIAINPSDMNVALHALGATVEVVGPKGKRSIAVGEFHRLVGKDPSAETTLRPGELIVAVTLPPAKFAKNSWYQKVRDRQSYAFAVVSVAAGLELEGGTIRSAGLALGGVAHKPWRVEAAEKALVGQHAGQESFRKAAELVMAGAKGYEHNNFKIERAKQSVVRALTLAAKGVQA